MLKMRGTSTGARLWDIPGSMIYFPMHGFRRYIPLGQRVNRAVKGLDVALNTYSVAPCWDDLTPFYGLFIEKDDVKEI